METSVEQQERGQAKIEVVDILNRGYRVHWADIKNLPKILRRGLYSPVFARKIGDVEYRERGSSTEEKDVHLTFPPSFMWGHKVSRAVGIVVDIPVDQIKDESVRFRIASRQFTGLVIADTLPVRTYSSTLEKLKETLGVSRLVVSARLQSLRRLLESAAPEFVDFPIYGMSGNLLLPKRMSHDEIVQMLNERK